MPAFLIENVGSDRVLHNKYGIYSKKELEDQIQKGSFTIEELGSVYGLSKFRMSHVLNVLDISYRSPLNDTRVIDSSIIPSVHQVFIGTLLGDAYMKNPKEYGLGHSINQMDYLYHVAERLSCFVSTVSYKKSGYGESLLFWTHRHEALIPYYHRFYSQGPSKKFITGCSASDLEPEGLAYWYMDDGKFDEYGSYLCVGNISSEEGAILLELLRNKFGIRATFQIHDSKKGYHNIYIKAESRNHFFELISSYIIFSMQYKVNGNPYPKVYTKQNIPNRHVQYCRVVNRPVRFFGDYDIQVKIGTSCKVIDLKSQYIKKLQNSIGKGELMSRTSIRKIPSDAEFRILFDSGMHDQEIADKFCFGRRRIAKIRVSMGIHRMPIRKSKIISENVVALCLSKKGMTDIEIGKILGVSRYTASRIRNSLGIPPKPKRPERYYDLTPMQEDQLKTLYSEGKNDYEVAKEMHMGRSRLRNWRKDHGVPSKTTKKGLSSDMCPNILSMLSTGSDLTQVANSYGVTRTSISKLLKKNNHVYVVRSRPRPPYVKSYLLTDVQNQVLLGDMFGDGGIVHKGNSKTAYYACTHAIAQEPFVQWKHHIFQPLSAKIKTIYNKISKEPMYVNTRTWSCKSLYDYYLRFYDNGNSPEKKLTPDLATELSPLSMAVWYMGDGSISRNTGVFHVGLQIDLEPIGDALTSKFSIYFKACKYDREWHLRVMHPDKFFPLIGTYLLDIFMYKVPAHYRDFIRQDALMKIA